MLLTAIILVCLLMLSALFAGAETSLFLVLKDRQLMADERRDRGPRSAVLRVLAEPSRLLMTVLLGNLLVNLIFFALSTIFVMEMERRVDVSAGVFVGIFFLLVVIIFGEILPKALAGVIPLLFARRSAWLILKVMQLLSPLVSVLKSVVEGINRLFGLTRKVSQTVSSGHLQDLVGVSGREGWFKGMHGEVLLTVMELHQLRLKDIFTPRVDVLSFSEDDNIGELLQQSRHWGASLIPLYKGHHDDISSYVDTVRLLGQEKNKHKAKTMAIPIPIFSELARMDLVLRAFLEQKHRLALVVDEYGEMSGIVTWNDVMKCLKRRVSCSESHKDRLFLTVSGRTKVKELDFFSGLDVGEAVTLSGLLSSHVGHIPIVGEEFDIEGVHLVVSKASTRSVIEVAVVIRAEGDPK
jgi:putative hemolysin